MLVPKHFCNSPIKTNLCIFQNIFLILDMDNIMNVTCRCRHTVTGARFSGKIISLTLYHKIPTLNDHKKKPFENIVGKGENAGFQHLLLFPQCFLPIPKNFLFLSNIYVVCKCFQSGPVSEFVVWYTVNPFQNNKFHTLQN